MTPTTIPLFLALGSIISLKNKIKVPNPQARGEAATQELPVVDITYKLITLAFGALSTPTYCPVLGRVTR
jgi:hypothetical protein